MQLRLTGCILAVNVEMGQEGKVADAFWDRSLRNDVDQKYFIYITQAITQSRRGVVIIGRIRVLCFAVSVARALDVLPPRTAGVAVSICASCGGGELPFDAIHIRPPRPGGRAAGRVVKISEGEVLVLRNIRDNFFQ